MTFWEKGNQYARSHLTRLPLKQACLPRGSQKRRPCQSRLLFLAFIVSQQNKPPAMPVWPAFTLDTRKTSYVV